MSTIIEKTGMRVFPALISFILLALFIAPFFVGIVNLGNCTGAFISAVMLGIFTFYRPFSRMIASLWQKPAGKAVICCISVIVIFCIILALVISGFMIRASRDAPEDSATTVVVLGCKVKNGRPTLMLRRRLDAAYDYLCDNKDVTVIVSGGQGSDETISEAQCMSEYLISKGIDSERIIIEDKSSSTYENLKFSREIIKENALCEKITIVTDGYHQLRAEIIAADLGMDAYNISAPTSPWLIPTYWVREWFGVIYQFVFG